MIEQTHPVAAQCLSCRFIPGGWIRDEWYFVKSPRMEQMGEWVQQEDHIENCVPAGVSPEDLEVKRANDTYASMVYARPFTGDLRVDVSMEFTYRMAPIIVLAPELGRDRAGRREYREHFEVCVYNEGVNVWHHTFADGKPSYNRDAYANFPLKPSTRYVLEVEIKGKDMSVRIDGREFGYTDESLPARSFVGITGCEGRNLFYDITVVTQPAGAP